MKFQGVLRRRNVHQVLKFEPRRTVGRTGVIFCRPPEDGFSALDNSTREHGHYESDELLLRAEQAERNQGGRHRAAHLLDPLRPHRPLHAHPWVHPRLQVGEMLRVLLRVQTNGRRPVAPQGPRRGKQGLRARGNRIPRHFSFFGVRCFVNLRGRNLFPSWSISAPLTEKSIDVSIY